MKFSKVTVRKKKLAKGRFSLYLDFYPPIIHPETGLETRREFLNLHFKDRPRTEEESTQKEKSIGLADAIRVTRETQIRDGQAGLNVLKGRESFISYFQSYLSKQKGSTANGYTQTLRHFKDFIKVGEISFDSVTPTLLDDFRHYLQNTARTRTDGRTGGLSHNTTATYMNKILAVCRKAYVDGLMIDVLPKLKRVKTEPSLREFLQLDELQSLAKTECDPPTLKRAALFSALTGLRFSDIAKMKWREVQPSPAGYTIQFKIQKTRAVTSIPISDKAVQLLGSIGDPDALVFPHLVYSHWLNSRLREWTLAAGISKKITFHAFRHTYATLQISAGTDIYTVSKMLGHKDIATTEIYAKLVDAKKRETVNRIDIEL
jgi:integrase